MTTYHIDKNHNTTMTSRFIALLTGVLAAALIQTGCTTTQSKTTTEPVKPGTAVIYNTELLQVTKDVTNATMAAIGTPVTYEIHVMAKKPITDVRIVERLNEALKYSSATPAAQVSGQTLTWDLGTMQAGDKKTLTVEVVPQKRGTYNVCSVITASPFLCLPIAAGQPVLTIVKTGPATVEAGQLAAWDITVTNTGDALAPGVTVTDKLPDTFTASGATTATIGDLKPGESRTVKVAASSTQSGSYTNTAAAQYAGGQAVTATAPIRIVQSAIDIAKTGPESSYALVTETYNIVVTNTGDTTLNRIMVEDVLPQNITLGTFTQGGAIRHGANNVPELIAWEIPSLAPKAKQTFTVNFTSNVPQTTTNVARLSTASGLTANDNQVTVWRAVPGIQTSIVDDVDPIRVGDQVVYTIRIINQGQLEALTASSVVTFPAEITPVSIGQSPMQGTVDGQKVTFAPTRISPRSEVVMTIVAKGAKTGNATVVLETTTNFRKDAVIDQESTTVY